MISIINYQYDVAKILINNMYNFDEINNCDHNVLFYAFYEKEILERLIKKGRIYLDNINCKVISLSIKAVMEERGDAVMEFLQAGIFVNQRNGDGKTAIFYPV